MRTLLVVPILGLAACAVSLDWPMHGRDGSRNAVSPEADPPMDLSLVPGKERNLLWSAKVGLWTFASPVVSEGLVWIGTDNERDGAPLARHRAGVLHCFRERDGSPLWRHESPDREGIPREARGFVTTYRSSPLVEGDRLYVLDPRWEVLCFDIGPLKRGEGEPRLVWKFDLLLTGVWPQIPGMGLSAGCSIGSSYRGMIYVSTGNGVEWASQKIAAPEAPALVCLDAATGGLLAREDSGISARTLMANRSSPAWAEGAGGDRPLLIFGGGDGFLYAFDPVPVEHPGRLGIRTLREVWRVDGNALRPQDERRGFLAAPVVSGGRVYAMTGESPNEEQCRGRLLCVEAATGRTIWVSDGIEVGGNPPVVDGDRVYVADAAGYVRGLDARTGRQLWFYDVLSCISTGPILAGGRLFVATSDSDLFVFDVRSDPWPDPPEPVVKRPSVIRHLEGLAYGGAVIANGTLLIAVERRLCAFRGSEDAGPADAGPRSPRGRRPDALFVPTPADLLSKVMDLAELKPTDVFYDLGSGDGRMVLAAAKRDACAAVGYEIDRALVERSRVAIRLENLEGRAKIEHEDLLKADLSQATVIFLYVGDRLTRALLPQLRSLPPGDRIVAHEFEIPGVEPEHVLHVDSREDGRDHVFRLYRTPLKKR